MHTDRVGIAIGSLQPRNESLLLWYLLFMYSFLALIPLGLGRYQLILAYSYFLFYFPFLSFGSFGFGLGVWWCSCTGIYVLSSYRLFLRADLIAPCSPFPVHTSHQVFISNYRCLLHPLCRSLSHHPGVS